MKIKIHWADRTKFGHQLLRLFMFISCAYHVSIAEVEIVHTTTGSVPNAFLISLITIAAKLSGKRVVLSIGGGDFLTFSQTARSIIRLILRLSFEISDILIPCNHEMYTALRNLEISATKILLISNALPNEIDTQKTYKPEPGFYEFKAKHSPLILFIGGFKENYGLLDLLIAINQLKLQYPKIGLVALVKDGGEPDNSKDIKNYIDNEGLENHLEIFNCVPWVVSAMRESDVLIRATRTWEGDSRAVREALALGIPVVASDIGYRPPGTVLYKAGDTKELAGSIRKVISKPYWQTPYVDPQGEENIRLYERLYQKLANHPEKIDLMDIKS